MKPLHIALLITCFLIIITSYLSDTYADPDLWGHIKFGMDHIQSGKLAEKDPFSYTAPNAEWINHEWLAEWILGFFYLWGGDRGLLFLRALILGGMILGLYWVFWMRWPQPFFVNVLLLLTVLPFNQTLLLRPGSFGFLFMVISMILFELYKKGHEKILWGFPLIMLIWVNTHGSFVLGLAFMTIAILSLYFDAEKDQIRKPKNKSLLIIFVLIYLMPFFTPYALRYLQYLIMAIPLERSLITEWAGLSGYEFKISLVYFSITLLGLFFSRHWRSFTYVVFFFICALNALMNRRFITFHFIFTFAVLLDVLRYSWTKYVNLEHLTIVRRFVTTGWVPFFVILLGAQSLNITLRNYQKTQGHLIVEKNDYPVGAIEFLKTHFLGPKLALPFDWGEYAIWHLSPNYKVNMDGRYETIYSPKPLEDAVNAYLKGDVNGFLQGYWPDVILVQQKQAIYLALKDQPEWKEVYQDGIAAIFIPTEKMTPALLESAAKIVQQTRQQEFFIFDQTQANRPRISAN